MMFLFEWIYLKSISIAAYTFFRMIQPKIDSVKQLENHGLYFSSLTSLIQFIVIWKSCGCVETLIRCNLLITLIKKIRESC